MRIILPNAIWNINLHGVSVVPSVKVRGSLTCCLVLSALLKATFDISCMTDT
jgi:hypothetical protein